jgi:hypothetical protein
VEVVVIRSPKRRKTAQARLVDGRLEVRIPARASKAEERRLVELFERRYRRSVSTDRVDVAARARVLAKRHDLPLPTEVRWVSNQSSRWGSCTPSTGVIRLSDRMARFPTWVIDAVLVHELAHLEVHDHGPAFRALVSRYPLLERAEGYLIACSGSDSPTEDPLATDLTAADLPAEADDLSEADPLTDDLLTKGPGADPAPPTDPSPPTDPPTDPARPARPTQGDLFDGADPLTGSADRSG